MKKLVSILLLFALLLCLVPGAAAAGSASWGGPETVRAGDTITLVFYAGGGIYGGSGTVSYDNSLLTLQGYTAAIGGSWRVEFTGNRFLFYDDSMASPISGGAAIFKATFTVNSNLQPGTQVTVTASGVTLSDGENDLGAGSPVYTRTIAPPLSDNCNLASLTVSNAGISPAFSPSVTNYSASVPFSTGALQVSAQAEHAGAQVSISNPALTPGGTTAVTVQVTAENGATKAYTIRVKRAQDPNYVPSSNAQLKALEVTGVALSPAFDANVQQYYIWLPYEAEAVSITAEKQDSKAKLEIGDQPELIPGKAVPMTVTVTAEDGTQKVYTLTVFRAPAHEDVDHYLFGEPEPEVTEPTPPPTEPEVTAPAVTEPKQNPIWVYLLVGAGGLLLGAALTAIIALVIERRKYKDLYHL